MYLLRVFISEVWAHNREFYFQIVMERQYAIIKILLQMIVHNILPNLLFSIHNQPPFVGTS